MLKTRLIPAVLFKNGIVAKTQKFNTYRNVGSCINVVKVYEARGVDELAFLDIDATQEGRAPMLHIIREVLDECFMPLTVGGGVKNLEDINNLLRIGADKVAINSQSLSEPGLIKKASEVFGSQCVVVSIDAKRKPNGGHEVFAKGGKYSTGLTPAEWAAKCETLGAGEILLNSIDQDGTMQGFDLKLISDVARKISIPVIACGGAGKPSDFVDAVAAGADAVSAASIFLYTQTTPREVKEHMAKSGIDVRL